MSAQVRNLKPLELNLTGKNAEEVLALLKGNGFSVDGVSEGSSIWDSHDSAITGKNVKGTRVSIIFIQDEEAHLLTVTIFNGKKVTLESGTDLHLFQRPKSGYPQGPSEWAVVRTLDIMA